MKALIVRLSSFGDVVLASSLIDPLKERGFDIDFLSLEENREIFLDDNRVNFIGTTKKNFLKDIRSLKKDYDVIFDAQKSFRTFILRFFVKGRFISYNKHSFRRRAFVKTKKFGKMFYLLDEYKKMLEDFFCEPFLDIKPKLLFSKEYIDNFSFIKKPFIILAVGARYEKKRYKKFKELSLLLKERGFEVVAIGKKDEEQDMEGIKFFGELSIPKIKALVSLSFGVISNDSFFSHLAKALNIPVFVIYGGTHPFFGFAPRYFEGDFYVKNISCQPCDIHGKGFCNNRYECLNIEPDKILNYAICTFYRLRGELYEKRG